MNSEQIATQFSPNLDLPYRYLLTGLGFLLAGVVFLVLYPHSLAGHYIRSQGILIIVHTFGIGFITSIMMGAMYQLLSVVLQVPIFSERLGKLNFWIYLAGLTGILVSFYHGFKKINITGFILAISLLIFVINAGLTIISARKIDIIIAHVITGVLSLFVVLVLGALMSENMGKNFLVNPLALIRTHLLFAILGWIIITTMGFSYRLIPMFMLSHGYNEIYAKVSFWTLMPGLVISGTSQLFTLNGVFEKLSFLLILAGILFYLIQMLQIFKFRLRKRIEPQIFATVVAKGFLLTGAIISPFVYYHDADYSTHYAPAIFLLLGFAGLYILGMMHKIVPFLEWYNKYSPKIGREKVPLTKEMIDESLIDTTVYLWIFGIVAIALGAWFSEVLAIRSGAIAMLFSTILFLWNIINVFRR